MLFLLMGIFEDKFAKITLQFVHVFYAFPSAIMYHSKTMLLAVAMDSQFCSKFKDKKEKGDREMVSVD